MPSQNQPVAASEPRSPRVMDQAAFEASAGTPEDRADLLVQAALAALESRASAMEAAAGLRMRALSVQAESLVLAVQEKLERMLEEASEQARELRSATPDRIVEPKPQRRAGKGPGPKNRSKPARRPARAR